MKKNIKNIKKGFTLIELIVVIAIIIAISSLTLFNSSGLNSSILVSNTAYEISLFIRDAQVSGLGAKVISVDDGGVFVATTSNQGIYFDINTPNEIVLFADLNKNNTYDVSGREESQVFVVENKRAGELIKICEIITTSTSETCTQKEKLTIMFKRPNPEAYFYTDANTGLGYQGSVAINFGFNNSECRSIIIYKTGAIQIDKSFCPISV